MRRLLRICLAALLAGSTVAAAQHPRDAEIEGPDTLAWWHTTEALSGDAMQGRDTGTAAYQQAADYVAKRFAAAGLQPAGEGGSFFQTVPMHEVDLTPEGTSFTVVRGNSQRMALKFLYEITAMPARAAAMQAGGALVFRGYCGSEAMQGVAGKMVVCFGTQRHGLPSAGERLANARKGGARGVLTVDDPYFTIEPPRWPYAYARSVTLREPQNGPNAIATQVTQAARGSVAQGSVAQGPLATDMLPPMRLSAAAFVKMLEGSGQDAQAILRTGGAQQPLASFDLPDRLEAKFHTTEKDIASPNVVAVLPGADRALRDQYVVVAAHLDGYGFGTPVLGDNLYNGALDDAAYVALLIQMADDLRDGKAFQPDASPKPRRDQFAGPLPGQQQVTGVALAPPKRSILFCAFTGEEKGLLGSTWFVEHPTVPLAQLAADINLDQLRPLFPLKILTAIAIHDTTLGATATAVGAGEGIELREDREPERGLLRRADHFPFLRAGVPAIGFVFGFDPGTDAETRYRHWYEVQYHRPQDDLTQPIDFTAAGRFNVFFYRLVETVADDPERPRMLPGSGFAKAP